MVRGAQLAYNTIQGAAVAMAVCLPLAPGLVPVAMAVLAAATLFYGRQQGKLHALSWTGPLPWMALYYAFHVLGLIWSSNMAFAQLDLGIKLPLLVFPALVVLGGQLHDFRRVRHGYILANALAVVLCLARALGRFAWQYAESARGGEGARSGFELSMPFFSSEFSFFLHPSYMAMYLTWALLLLLMPLAPGAERPGRRWAVACGSLFLLGILLCASKAGWAILVPCAIALMVERRADRSFRKAMLLAMACMLALGAVLYSTTDLVRERVQQAFTGIGSSQPASAATGSTNDRLLVWHAAATLIREHPVLGVGTGDVKDALMKVYGEKGFAEPFRKQLNAHDQYLNTAVALGLGAAAVLVLMVLVPVAGRWRHRYPLLGYFLVVNALNWTVESMLEVQAGVMFFAFFAWACTANAGAPEDQESVTFSPARHDPLRPAPHRREDH